MPTFIPACGRTLHLAGVCVNRIGTMEFVQELVPKTNYTHDKLNATAELLYQLGFLARCEPGDYAVTTSAPLTDVAVIDALVSARKDGSKVIFEPSSLPKGRYRMAICSIEEAPMLASSLLPGGLMIARSAKPLTYENEIEERTVLLNAGLAGCGSTNGIHWAFARPHFLSMDAILWYIEQNMMPKNASEKLVPNLLDTEVRANTMCAERDALQAERDALQAERDARRTRWLLDRLGEKIRHFPRDLSRRVRASLKKRGN